MLSQISIQQRPLKRTRTESISPWTAPPCELFIEIFENLQRQLRQIKETLPKLCVVCHAWVHYSSKLKLRLANVHGLSMYNLFGNNQRGIRAFIETHRDALLTFNLLSSKALPIALSALHLNQLHTLKIKECSGKDWKWIVSLPKLSTLELRGGISPNQELTQKSVVQILTDLASMSTLTTLYAGNINPHISKNLPMLTNLTALKSFDFPLRLKGDNLKVLSLFSELRRLDLTPFACDTTDWCNGLSLLTKLVYLYIEGGRCSVDIQFLKNLVNLEVLEIHSVEEADDSHFELFSSLSNLSKLELCEWDIEGRGLQFLEPLTQLKTLNLVRCSEIQLNHLACLTFLKELECHSLCEEDLPLLSSLTNLEILKIDHVTEAADWQFLKQLANLKNLRLRESTLSVDVFEVLAYVSCLQIFEIFDCEFEDTCLVKLNKLNDLTVLTLQDCRIDGTAFFCQPLFARITALDLSGSTIQTIDKENIACMTNLVSLNVESVSAFDDTVVNCLAELTSIEHLNLNDCPVSAEQLLCLTTLKNLNVLRITAHRDIALKAAFKYVENLYIAD